MPEIKRIGAAFGIATPVIAFTFIFTSISLSPWFSWYSNALSDLGNYARSGVAPIFNLGLIISGILTVVFGLGILEYLKNRKLGKAGVFILMIAGAALTCIGIFSEDFGEIHFYASVAFFSLFPISLLIIGAALILECSRGFGIFSIIIAILAGIPWPLYFTFTWGGVAIPEITSVAFDSVWSITAGIKMLSGRFLNREI